MARKDAGSGGDATGVGLTIECHGQYYYKTQTEKGVKPFTRTVRAPSLEVFRETAYKYLGTDDKGKPQYKENSFLNVRGQLKRRLLPLLLKQEFADFARVRFVVIDEIVNHGEGELDLPIQLRSREQLKRMIEREHIPIDSADYIEVDELRTDILEYIQDPKMFLATKERRDKRREQDRLFAQMNKLEPGAMGPRKEEKPRASAATAAGIDSL